MKIAILNKNNTMMAYKQLSLILTILLLLFTFSFACSPAVNPTDNTGFTPSLHIKVSDGSTDITENLTIAVNNSNLISITGLSNTVASNKTYTLTITPVADLFSTQGNSPITITIAEPQDFSPGPGVLSPSNSFTITNVNDPSKPLNYTLKVSFSGAPVEDWFDTDYISASFNSQAASLELNGTTLSVIGLYNADSGESGAIKFNLPPGFVAIPESITLPDPDGAAITAATIIPSSATFTIRESDNIENSQEYTIKPITLAAVTAFTPSVHIKITDDGITDPTLNDITNMLTIDVNTENLITISGLSNAVTDKTYTLTIAPVEDIFSTSSGTDITITITEPDGFLPGDGVLTPSDNFTITNDGDSNSIRYTVVVPFSVALVEEWLTADTFSTYFTGATYAGQTASLSFDGSTIAIGGDINNVPNGVILLTTTLPLGYSLTPELSDLDGDGIAALTDADAGSITIAEEGNTENAKTYDVTISLGAYESPVKASHISVTGFDGLQIDSNDIDIQIEENIITISGLSNEPSDSGTGSVTITPLAGEYTVDPNPFTLTFDNPAGTNMVEDSVVGTVDIVTADDFTVSHTIILNLEAYESPVRASHVTAEFYGITARPSNIKIIETNIIISGFPNIADSAGATVSGSVTITPPATREYTVSAIDPASFPFNFTDPDGTEFEEITAGTFNVRSADVDVLHTIFINFSALIELEIDSDYVENSPLTIISGGNVTLKTNLNACELLPTPTFKIDGNPAAVTGFPSYFDRRIDSSAGDGSAPYTVDGVLIIEDANGDVLDDSFTVSVAGFPACDDGDIFTSSGKTGDDADNAYEIDTAPKLELLSHLVNTDNENYGSKSYKLTRNIDLGLADFPLSEEASGETGEGFPPIGIVGSLFKGTFDCDDHSISNLYINKATVNNIGLFGITETEGASIQNCSLINVNITGKDRVGGLAGHLFNYSSITNSSTTGTVSGNDNVGGLVGRLYDSSITNSYTRSSVSGNDEVGGLVGYLTSSSLTSSITKSYATGSVTGHDNIGGLAGYVDGFTNSTNITYSYATGSVSGTGNNVGGLAGQLDTSGIKYSYATGKVEGTGDDVGGFAGYVFNTSSIENSYASGDVEGSNSVGGLAGQLDDDSSITYSYATGEVEGTGDDVGGLAGQLNNNSTITNSYWDTDTSEQIDSAGAGDGAAMGRTTDDLKRGSAGEDIFTGWLSTVWKFAPDTVYPRLKMVVCANRQYRSSVPTDCIALQ